MVTPQESPFASIALLLPLTRPSRQQDLSCPCGYQWHLQQPLTGSEHLVPAQVCQPTQACRSLNLSLTECRQPWSSSSVSYQPLSLLCSQALDDHSAISPSTAIKMHLVETCPLSLAPRPGPSTDFVRRLISQGRPGAVQEPQSAQSLELLLSYTRAVTLLSHKALTPVVHSFEFSSNHAR